MRFGSGRLSAKRPYPYSPIAAPKKHDGVIVPLALVLVVLSRCSLRIISVKAKSMLPLHREKSPWALEAFSRSLTGHRSTRRTARGRWKLWASVWCAVALWAGAVIALSTIMRPSASRRHPARQLEVGEDEKLPNGRDLFISQMQHQQERASKKRHFSMLSTPSSLRSTLRLRSKTLSSF